MTNLERFILGFLLGFGLVVGIEQSRMTGTVKWDRDGGAANEIGPPATPLVPCHEVTHVQPVPCH